MPVYSKPLTINKGVDNKLSFQFLNPQQKSVDISGMGLTFRILDQTATKVIFKKTMSLTLPLTGIATLEVSGSELEEIDSQRCYYSIEYTNTNGSNRYPVYMDQLAGARGDVEICNSVLPSFVPSDDVTIPTGQLFPDPTLCDFMSMVTVTYYTSAINTMDNNCLTLQASYRQFYGNVTIQGSTLESSGWYTIDTVHNYENLTDTVGYNVRGYHPWVRMKFESSYGWVDNVKAR